MRVNIEFPTTYIFTHTMTITKAHENIGGHLAHDKVVTIIGDCRDAWFESMGFPGCVVGDIGMVNSDLMLMYIAEGFHNDELIVRLALGDMNKYGGDMLMQAIRTSDQQEVFRAKSGFVFYDYDKRKVTERPQAFNAKANLQ